MNRIKKARVYIGVLALSLGLIVSPLVSLVPKPVSADDMDTNITTLLTIGAISDCFASNWGKNRLVTTSDRVSLDGMNKKVIIGHYVTGDGDNNQVKCSDLLSSQSLQSLGYSDIKALMLAVGYEVTPTTDPNVKDALEWHPVNASKDTMALEIQKKLRAAKGISDMTAAERYILSYKTFATACSSSVVAGAAVGSDTWNLAKQNEDNYTLVDVPDDNGGTATKIFREAKLGSKIDVANKYLWLAAGNSPSSNLKCTDLAKSTQTYSAAYRTYQQKQIAANGKPDSSSNINDPEESTGTSSCAIDGVGWILCPAMNFVAHLTDAMYGIIQNWLEVSPSLYSKATTTKKGSVDSGTYRGWMAMRDIANAGIIVVFLIIVMSQVTGFGLSNYGIKKILPRLIIVAIVINISFYLMQVLLDVSNILGGTLNTFLRKLPVFADSGGWINKGNMFLDVLAALIGGQSIVMGAGLGITIASGGALIYGGIGFFVLILLAGFLAIGFFFLMLALRQALVVILVVLSPLALLAMILPNTKNLYTKWQKAFVAVLVIYPMAALLFGGSQLAANIIIQNVANAGDDVTKGIMTAILGLGVATVPLFAIVPMIKMSLNALPLAGGAMQKIQGKLSSPLHSGIKSGGKKARQGVSDHARDMALRGKFGSHVQGLTQARLRRENRLGGYAHSANRQGVEYMARYTAGDPSATEAERAVAVGNLAKLNEEEAKAKKMLLERDTNGKPIAPERRIGHFADQLSFAIGHGDAQLAQQATAALRTSGAPGRERLEKTLLANDAALSGPQGYGSDVSRAIRQDLSDNIKANNNALARWSTSAVETDGDGNITGYKSLETMLGRENSMAGLTRGEQASQDTYVLKRQKQYIKPDDAAAILDNERIEEKSLSADKSEIFRQAATPVTPAASAPKPGGGGASGAQPPQGPQS